MVKASASYSARPDWFDRNPTTPHYAYVARDVAPHGSTVRKTYTVPAGKKAMLEVVELKVLRKTAPTTNGIASCYMVYTPSGGSPQNLFAAEIFNASIGAADRASIGATIVLKAGDQIDTCTQDLSTAGTCDYISVFKATEFDA